MKKKTSPQTQQQIAQLRKAQDGVNRQLLRLLRQRLQISRQIWSLKKQVGRPALDKGREVEILQVVQKAGKTSQEKQFLTQVFKKILSETRKTF